MLLNNFRKIFRHFLLNAIVFRLTFLARTSKAAVQVDRKCFKKFRANSVGGTLAIKLFRHLATVKIGNLCPHLLASAKFYQLKYR